VKRIKLPHVWLTNRNWLWPLIPPTRGGRRSNTHTHTHTHTLSPRV